MKEKLVSVIIPTLASRHDQLEKAVDSVNRQTYKNIELVVVIEGDSACEGRNIGIKRSNGDFIAFLDDDDAWEPTKIEKQMKVMDKYTSCPLVTCYSNDHRFNRDSINCPPFVADKNVVLNAFNYSSTSAYLFRSDPLKEYGGFDESLKSAHEYDIAIAMSKNHNLRCVSEILVTQNNTVGQISEDWTKKRKGILQVYRKHKAEFNNASFMNRFKVFGLYALFLSGSIFGNKIYWILSPMKKRHEVIPDNGSIIEFRKHYEL